MNKNIRCENCWHWVPVRNTFGTDIYYGTCTALPPTRHSEKDPNGVWPTTFPGSKCGSFKASSEEAQTEQT